MMSAASTSKAVLQRLEYGKFCVSGKGAIEPREEHQILGASGGFPEEWRTKCTPGGFSLGVTPREAEGESLLARKTPSGVVFRSVRHAGRFGRLAYRMGIRSEGGEEEARYYTVARYVFDGTATISPYQIYRSIGAIEGFVRNQSVCELEAAQESPSMQLEEYPDLAEGALTAIMSALPVGIAGSLEDEFFQIVDRIWADLPAEVRRIAGAGWNVSSALASELSISYSPNKSSGALYDVCERKWVRGPEEPTPSLPGWQYVQRRFKRGKPEHSDVLRRLESSRLNSAPELPPIVESVLPDCPTLGNEPTRRFICDLGDLGLNGRLWEAIRFWIDGGDLDWKANLSMAVHRICGDQKLHEQIIEEVLQPKSGMARKRQDELALLILRFDTKIFDCAALGNAHRICFFWALAKADATGAVEHYSELATQRQTDDLPAESIARFSELLTSTLVPGCLRYHDRLLGRDKIYDRLLEPIAERAAAKWAENRSPEVDGLLGRLTRLLPDGPRQNYVKVLHAFVKGGPPPNGSREALTESAHLAKVIEDRWREKSQGNSPTGCDHLTAWAPYFPAQQFQVPLLRLAGGGAILNFNEMLQAIDEMGLADDPLLQKKLGAELFRFVPAFTTEIAGDWKRFEGLLAFWPREVFHVCFGYLEPAHSQLCGADMDLTLTPAAEAIPELWRRWRQTDTNEKSQLASTTIFEWCSQMVSPQSNHPYLVRAVYIAASGYWDRGSPIPREESGEAFELIRQARVRLKFAKQLWRSAREYWQCIFVMEMHPDEILDFEPMHWNVLLMNRDIALNELAELRIGERMRQSMMPVSYDFFDPGISMDRSGWKPEYIDTPLWAAYGILPRNEQSFLIGLEVYATNDEAKAKCCIKFLETHGVSQGQTRAREMVAGAFVAECLKGLIRSDLDVFWKTLGDLGYREQGRVIYQLRVMSGGSSPAGIRTEGTSTFAVELWLIHLIMNLTVRFSGAERLKEYIRQTLERRYGSRIYRC